MPPADASAAPTDLAAFVRSTLDDPAVRAALLPLRDAAFVEELIALAAGRGLVVTAAEVDEGLRQARRAWWERWV